MKKKDYLFLAILLGLLFAWPHLDRLIHRTFFKSTTTAKPSAPAVSVSNATTGADATIPATPAKSVQAETAVLAPPVQPEAPTQQWTLKNEVLELSLSSLGAAIESVTLADYRSQIDPASPPVHLDFTSAPALAYSGIAELGASVNFAGAVDAKGRQLTAERRTSNGLRLVRTITLGDRFELRVEDVLKNEGTAPFQSPEWSIATGPMRREAGHKDMTGFVSLGIDSLSPGGHDVVHWGSKLAKQFEAVQEERNLPKLPLRVDTIPETKTEAIDWLAAKNKYFVQLVTPDEGADALRFILERAAAPVELQQPDAEVKMTTVESVAAAAVFRDLELAPGEEWRKGYSVYIGPKKLAELGVLSMHRDEVMEIGAWLKPISKVLLRILNGIHQVIPNYGIAIMLLTIIIRLVFWPVTHKSSQSMKRMAELQPLIKQVQEKYQKDPQRMQREMMQIYKDHKVNPVAGCLPMLIQIPFFFALFLVLRSAIELRFASFLWIQDLSEPENLFANVIGFPVNILPLLMAATMYWQQKITPTAGDPQQAKMMRIMMTGMMLFFLYGYAAGLALYWTTQNLLMIVQQLWMTRKKPAPAAAG